MIYNYYVYSRGGDVPFMDLHECASIKEAVEHCHALMAERPRSCEAHLYRAAKLLRIIKKVEEARVFDRGLSDTLVPPLG